MATFIQEGVYLDYTPEAALVQGDVVAIEDDFFGVATAAIGAGELGALAVQGVFEFDSDGVIAAGALVFWDSETETVSATPADDCYIGRAVAAAADDKCRVSLNASNIGEYTAIVPGTTPAATQVTFAALTAVDPDAITAADPTVVDPTTEGIDGAEWAAADSVVKAAIEANNTAIKAVEAELEKLIDDVTSTRTQLVAAIADLATLRTAVNAGKVDLAAVVTQLEAALVLE